MNLQEFFRQIITAPVETFGVVFHGPNGFAGHRIISKGRKRRVLFNAADVIAAARECGAQTITMVHNHPHGKLRPSVDDLDATYRLHDFCKPLGLPVVDHIILNNTGERFSFVENGIEI